ncbi:hypothetical protein So717_22190 [Roseobacter cerasinus]|uniref:Uncharacterized protein n=1 Tax=Roseobacter cerasinus TaxID=2602289 RepID=A0A640VW35_9RHOB|nr:hypothetical protein So717_22190 [Roseobacter cerasinus]
MSEGGEIAVWRDGYDAPDARQDAGLLQQGPGREAERIGLRCEVGEDRDGGSARWAAIRREDMRLAADLGAAGLEVATAPSCSVRWPKGPWVGSLRPSLRAGPKAACSPGFTWRSPKPLARRASLTRSVA